MQSNLFVHEIGLKIRAWSDMEGIEVIGYDWGQNSMKKIEKRSLKIKSCKSWMPSFLFDFFDLDHSYISTECNPSAHDPKMRIKLHYQTQFFWQKFQIWKPISRTIQGQIVVPLASLRIIERVPIKINHPNTQNWYTEVKLFSLFFIIVFWDLNIFIA